MSELFWSIEVWGHTEAGIRSDARRKLEDFLGYLVNDNLIELDVDGVETVDGSILHYRGTARYRRDA